METQRRAAADSSSLEILFSSWSAHGVGGNSRNGAAEGCLGGTLDHEKSDRRFRRRARWNRACGAARASTRHVRTQSVAQGLRKRRRGCRDPSSASSLQHANLVARTSRIHPQAARHTRYPTRASEPPPDRFQFRRNRASSVALFDEPPPTALKTQERTPRRSCTREMMFSDRPTQAAVGNRRVSSAGRGLGSPP